MIIRLVICEPRHTVFSLLFARFRPRDRHKNWPCFVLDVRRFSPAWSPPSRVGWGVHVRNCIHPEPIRRKNKLVITRLKRSLGLGCGARGMQHQFHSGVVWPVFALSVFMGTRPVVWCRRPWRLAQPAALHKRQNCTLSERNPKNRLNWS